MSRPHGDKLARFREGDAEAFAQLVAEMGPRLKGYFLRQGAQPATAEDLTQNVFLRTLQGKSRYHEEGRLEAYFLRIARNLWIDHRRRRRPVVGDEDLGVVEGMQAGPVETAAVRDRAERLRAALRELDPDSHEILELAVLQRLAYRDVAAILEIPVGTVKSRVFYALRRLRQRLDGSGMEEEE
ncbi:MAG: sigma-70 family RNA polymerase sigma factor [Planctomycetota bacterium]|nr:MAG: sigma-70 family RNA polymerase sigma factor [Planctomycetota bacterium]